VRPETEAALGQRQLEAPVEVRGGRSPAWERSPTIVTWAPGTGTPSAFTARPRDAVMCRASHRPPSPRP
jgi:hypothetical protein